jgi:hypothetical protein
MQQWCSLANRWNDEVGWVKRFFDEFKNALCGVIDFDKGITIIGNPYALPKTFLNLTETCRLKYHGYK